LLYVIITAFTRAVQKQQQVFGILFFRNMYAIEQSAFTVKTELAGRKERCQLLFLR
jgi:hypothetical protein